MSSRAVRRAAGVVVRSRAHFWRPHSRLFLIPDVSGWVISRELLALGNTAESLGIRQPPSRWVGYSRKQCIFFGSHHTALRRPWPRRDHRVGMAYFHGLPGTPGQPDFDDDLRTLRERRDRICRIQVSHRQMRDVLVEAGFPHDRIFRIPIGIEIDLFEVQTARSRSDARDRFGLPQSACIVGSFQKDGVGWGQGLEPKMIKGPDVLLRVLERLRANIRELFVVLSGPARGYVRAGLERLGIPYRAYDFRDYEDVASLYQALDAYLVTSRQEGGPKAVLETMASGIPLVTTRVGQAMDLVQHEVNGWMVGVDDTEGLCFWLRHALESGDHIGRVLARARELAEEHAYERQLPLWRPFFSGFVEASGVPDADART